MSFINKRNVFLGLLILSFALTGCDVNSAYNEYKDEQAADQAAYEESISTDSSESGTASSYFDGDNFSIIWSPQGSTDKGLYVTKNPDSVAGDSPVAISSGDDQITIDCILDSSSGTQKNYTCYPTGGTVAKTSLTVSSDVYVMIEKPIDNSSDISNTYFSLGAINFKDDSGTTTPCSGTDSNTTCPYAN